MPLGTDAVHELTRGALGERTDPALVETCVDVSGGNPFYVHELLLALAGERELRGAALTRRARGLAPDAVTRSLRVRVGRLGPAAAALARAVAILGDDVPLRRAAALAGLPIDAATAAADSLAGSRSCSPASRSGSCIRSSSARSSRTSAVRAREPAPRRRTAAVRRRRERRAGRRAPLARPCRRRPWVVEQLSAAAREARALQPAVRYLERALAEPPTPSSVPRCSPSSAPPRPRSPSRRPPTTSPQAARGLV